MRDPYNIKLIERIAKELGKAPTTVCGDVLNDGRAYERSKKRRAQDLMRRKRLLAFARSATASRSEASE